MTTSDTALQVLLVEDEYLIALDIEDSVQRHGYHVQAIAQSVAASLAMLEVERPDIVLLDANLRNESATPVARKLREKGIPYIVVSSMPRHMLPEALLGEAPFVAKPHNEAKLVRELAQVAARRASYDARQARMG